MKDSTFNTYYKQTTHFEITNPNPRWAKQKGYIWDTGDCCIRALANSIGAEWIDAFDYLSAKARRDFSVPNDTHGFRQWLVEGGSKWTAVKAQRGSKRMTVLDFAEEHPIGHYVVTIANHETAVVDGVIRDAWNCGKKCIYGYHDMTDFRIA